MSQRKESVAQLLEIFSRLDQPAMETYLTQHADTVRECLSDPAFMKVEIAQHDAQGAKIYAIEGIREWNAIESSPTRQKTNQQTRTRWRAMIDRMNDAGFVIPDSEKICWLHSLLNTPLDLPCLHWMVDRGVFALKEVTEAGQKKREPLRAPGLVHSLRAQGVEEQALLKRLHALGVLTGPRCLFGITDLACEGQWLNAQCLVDLGEEPQVCKAGGPTLHSLWGATPIEAYLGMLSLDPVNKKPHGSQQETGGDSNTAEQRLAHAQQALLGLRQLVRFGARVDASNLTRLSANQGGRRPRLAGSASALGVLLGGGDFGHSRKIVSPELFRLLAPELLALGCDPNDGGALAERVARLYCCEQHGVALSDEESVSAQEVLDWSLEQGLSLAQHAGVIHQNVYGGRNSKETLCFEQQGAKIDGIGVHDPSPVRDCFARGAFDWAWPYIEAGAPVHYVDENSEGVLHVLSTNATKASEEQLKKVLARPEVAALIGLRSAREGHEGEQPLHQACGALNVRAIKLLLAAGADTNAQDAKGWTPIRHALRKVGAKAQDKALPLLRMLIAHGADVSIRDAKGLTAAQSAAAKAPLPALMELLSLRPEDIGGQDGPAKEAKGKLHRRGGLGLAIAEQADLRHEVGLTKRESPQVDGIQGDETLGSPNLASSELSKTTAEPKRVKRNRL